MSASAVSLRGLAVECRHLASGASMPNVAASLSEMAFDYDRQAARAEKAEAAARAHLARPANGG